MDNGAEVATRFNKELTDIQVAILLVVEALIVDYFVSSHLTRSFTSHPHLPSHCTHPPFTLYPFPLTFHTLPRCTHPPIALFSPPPPLTLHILSHFMHLLLTLHTPHPTHLTHICTLSHSMVEQSTNGQ